MSSDSGFASNGAARFDGELSPEDLFNMFFGGGGGGFGPGFGPGFATSFGAGGPSACCAVPCTRVELTSSLQLSSHLEARASGYKRLPSVLVAVVKMVAIMNLVQYSSSCYPFSCYLLSLLFRPYQTSSQHHRRPILVSHSVKRQDTARKWKQEDWASTIL